MRCQSIAGECHGPLSFQWRILMTNWSFLIAELFDLFVPLRTIKIKLSKPQWITSDIIGAMKIRDKAYSKWTRARTDSNYRAYSALRNKVTTLKRNSKRAFAREKLDTKLPPSLFWKNLRKLGIGKSRDNTTIPFTPDELNKHYCSIGTTSSNNLNFDNILFSGQFDDSPLLSFVNITSLELYKAILSIKSEAIGLDRVSIKFIKLIFPFISPYLLFIFNSIITKSYFPKCWKIAKITPIPKVKNLTQMSELRPISVLPTLSKAFEIILKTQISNHIKDNNLLCEYQSAYRSGFSTASALLTITDDIRRQADVNKFTVLTLLDFSKAFDSISHSILCKKLLSEFKFSNPACKLIYSYLTGRSQMVDVNGTLSIAMPTWCGVPQGSVLGPLLFSLYINDVGKYIKFCKFHLFADDLQIYISDEFQNKDVCIKMLNEDLQSIFTWSINNKLLLNNKKTQAILLSMHKRADTDFPEVLLNNERVVFSDSVRNLGLTIDTSLSWNDHINEVCRRVYCMLRMLWKTADFLDTRMKYKLFMAYILPHLTFCDVIMFGMQVGIMAKLKKLLNSCVRFIFSLRKFDHISQFKNLLLGSDIDKYLEMRTCMYIHKIVSNQIPPYLFEKFQFANSSRTRHIKLPINRSRIYNSSFFVSGAKLYNKLPHTIRSCNSVKKFGELYREYFKFEPKFNNK